MSYNFKKSFLFLVVSIFFVQSFFIGCNTEVDSEVVIIDEEKPKTPEAKISKEYSISGIPAAWSETDVYAYAYDDNGNRVLIPVTVEDGVVTFKADETYTKCVLVSLPKGTDDAAYTANPASILNADCQKSEVIDLTKDNLAFVLAKSDYIGTWNSISDELILNEDGTYSLDIENNDSADYAGTYVDTKTGLKASYSEKVEETDVQKEIVFTKKEADVLVGIINEKETYFVKASSETPNLSGTWTSSDETTTTIINNESEKIYVKNGETEIWGIIVQSGNMFILQDEESNILGTGVVSASGSAYIYNEATGSYEIYTRNGSATESDSTIPLKTFTVTYKSEFAKDDVKEITEGIVLELENPTYKGYRFDGWYTDEEKTTKAEAKYTISENLTFYAKWIQQGTVKFTSAQSEHDDVVVDLGTKITIPTPTKEKFDFDGWYDGETKVEVADYTVTKDVTLVAKWTALYDVTFDSAGGSTVDSVTNVRAGTTIPLPTAPTYNDYEFDCWTDGTSTYAPETEYTVNSDVTFTAKWKGLFTVTYNTNGGESIPAETVSDGTEITMQTPTKEEYTFNCWTDGINNYQIGDTYTVTSDVTFTVVWVEKVTVAYESDYEKPKDVTVDINTEITLPTLTYEGYRFAGWYTDDEDTLIDAGTVHQATSDITFTAKWIAQYSYNFNYNLDNPVDAEADIDVDEGTVITLPTPVKYGCTFAGWSDGATTYDAGASYTITETVLFNAIWNVTVTYVSDNSKHEEKTIAENSTVILPAPECEGYDFDGWYISDENSLIVGGTEYLVAENVTFTAKWTEVYTVNYIAESTTTITVRADSATVNFPINPEKEGYTFAGWSIENSEDTYFYGNSYEVADDVTFVANWIKEPVTYSVSGLPTDGTWDSVIVYAWGAAGKENGNFVTANLNDGTVTFSSTEDYTNCIIVSTSESYDTLAAATAESTGNAYSEDLSFVDGEAIFELPKVTYTITEVVSWWGNESTQSYVKLSTDEGDNVLVEATYDSETATITFATDYEFDTCVVCRFASDVTPESADLTTYSESELPNISAIIVMDENNSAVFVDSGLKNLADTNSVYLRDDNHWQYNGDYKIYAHFSSSTDLSVEILDVEMTLMFEAWFKATVDYSLYDTVYFTGNESDGVQCSQSLTMDKEKIFYRLGSSGKDTDGKYKLYAYSNTTDDLD